MAIPTDYTNLELWFKSDTGRWQDTAGTVAASANGDPIGRWDDQSGNSRHATQATSGTRPTVSTTTQLNSIPSIEFSDTTVQRLDLPNFMSGFTSGEAFSVTKLRTNQPTVQARTAYWRFGNEAAGGNINTHIRWTDGFTYERFGTTVRKEAVAVAETLGNWFIYDVWSASNDYAIVVNNWPYYTSGVNTVGFTTTPAIGSLASDASFHFDGWWQELIFYSRKLSDSERAAIMSYLSTRYALIGAAQITRLQGVVIGAGTPSSRVTRVQGSVIGSGAAARVTRVQGSVIGSGAAARITHLLGYVIASRIRRRSGVPWFIG